ncbi:hypothetical protein LIA77_11646 [Sarocladium implicatum]|nr:hypothetical protein LIA77_11646 [Sarocladium implicatum]
MDAVSGCIVLWFVKVRTLFLGRRYEYACGWWINILWRRRVCTEYDKVRDAHSRSRLGGRTHALNMEALTKYLADSICVALVYARGWRSRFLNGRLLSFETILS